MQGDAFLTRMAEALFEGIKSFIYPIQTAAGQAGGPASHTN
jgi:hypothetical protein